MKNIISTLCLFLLCATCISAQDILVLQTGADVKCKVLELTPTEVKYKDWDNLNGPLITILKTTAFRVRYENGKTEIFNKPVEVPLSNSRNFYPFGVKHCPACRHLLGERLALLTVRLHLSLLLLKSQLPLAQLHLLQGDVNLSCACCGIVVPRRMPPLNDGSKQRQHPCTSQCRRSSPLLRS